MTWNDLPLPLLRRIAETTTNHDILNEICKHDYRSVRIYVVYNKHTPPSVLAKMTNDMSFVIRSRAKKRIDRIYGGGWSKAGEEIDKILIQTEDY